MARRLSVKSLKDEKPYWYCIPQHYGTVSELAQSGKNLQYVVESREIADVWRVIGNPKFRTEYAYLLVSINSNTGEFDEVYAVKPEKSEEMEEKEQRKGRRKILKGIMYGGMGAFAGHVDKICYGWTTKIHAKHIIETGRCCTGDIPAKPFDI